MRALLLLPVVLVSACSREPTSSATAEAVCAAIEKALGAKGCTKATPAGPASDDPGASASELYELALPSAPGRKAKVMRFASVAEFDRARDGYEALKGLVHTFASQSARVIVCVSVGASNDEVAAARKVVEAL